MMVWTEPKTDWVSTDRFNISDYNRIHGNITYLISMYDKYYGNMSESDMGSTISDYSGFFKSRYFNAFENNIEYMNEHSLNGDIGATKAFYDNGVFIDYAELNRLESACLTLYQALNNVVHDTRLSFTFGQYKALRV